MADSKQGFARRADSRRSDRLAFSPLVMPSFRTSDVATTRSPSISRQQTVFVPHSTSLWLLSDRALP